MRIDVDIEDFDEEELIRFVARADWLWPAIQEARDTVLEMREKKAIEDRWVQWMKDNGQLLTITETKATP